MTPSQRVPSEPTGSNTVPHIQAYLLAGLYAGQLARKCENFSDLIAKLKRLYWGLTFLGLSFIGPLPRKPSSTDRTC